METLHWECGHKSLHKSMTTFGVDFSEHVQETQSDIPRLLWKCTKEIDERGLDVKVLGTSWNGSSTSFDLLFLKLFA